MSVQTLMLRQEGITYPGHRGIEPVLSEDGIERPESNNRAAPYRNVTYPEYEYCIQYTGQGIYVTRKKT